MGAVGKNLLSLANVPVANLSNGPLADVLREEAIGLKGKIKRLIRLRGFGFISAENGDEVFFHCSVLRGEDFDALQKGISVEFEFTRSPKGPRAVYCNSAEITGDPKSTNPARSDHPGGVGWKVNIRAKRGGVREEDISGRGQ